MAGSRIATPTSLPDPASSPSPDLKRRHFLLAIGAGSAAVVTTAANAAPLAAQAAPPEQAVDAPSTYRATEHVRDYYRSTKI